jgi:hypothetical protein
MWGKRYLTEETFALLSRKELIQENKLEYRINRLDGDF